VTQDHDTILDFRSDTVTQPCPAMRRAMAEAEVGDDVLMDDPTVRRLEAICAERFGREAALFVPSGTMANLIGVALHCERGDELILERRTHSFAFEVGGPAALLGVLVNPVDCDSGFLEAAALDATIRPRNVHMPVSRLAIIENTSNIAGGLVVPLERIRELRSVCSERGLALHMDGARIWNAAAASRTGLKEYAAEVDSLSCCLSKGLGCPVGSLVVGDAEQIHRARRLRKMMGGAMRQVGILAAAGIYALEHNVDRLAEDHALARELAAVLGSLLGDAVSISEPESNMVLVRMKHADQAQILLKTWNDHGIRALTVDPVTIRLVTHLDLSRDAAKLLKERTPPLHSVPAGES